MLLSRIRLLVHKVLLNWWECMTWMELLSGVMRWGVFPCITNTICMILDYSGYFLSHHHFIFAIQVVLVTMLGQVRSSWTHSFVYPISLCLTMESFYLKLSKFDVEVLDEVLKDIPTFTHQLCSLFICKYLINVFIRFLKVWEQK